MAMNTFNHIEKLEADLWQAAVDLAAKIQKNFEELEI